MVARLVVHAFVQRVWHAREQQPSRPAHRLLCASSELVEHVLHRDQLDVWHLLQVYRGRDDRDRRLRQPGVVHVPDHHRPHDGRADNRRPDHGRADHRRAHDGDAEHGAARNSGDADAVLHQRDVQRRALLYHERRRADVHPARDVRGRAGRHGAAGRQQRDRAVRAVAGDGARAGPVVGHVCQQQRVLGAGLCAGLAVPSVDDGGNGGVPAVRPWSVLHQHVRGRRAVRDRVHLERLWQQLHGVQWDWLPSLRRGNVLLCRLCFKSAARNSGDADAVLHKRDLRWHSVLYHERRRADVHRA